MAALGSKCLPKSRRARLPPLRSWPVLAGSCGPLDRFPSGHGIQDCDQPCVFFLSGIPALWLDPGNLQPARSSGRRFLVPCPAILYLCRILLPRFLRRDVCLAVVAGLLVRRSLLSTIRPSAWHSAFRRFCAIDLGFKSQHNHGNGGNCTVAELVVTGSCLQGHGRTGAMRPGCDLTATLVTAAFWLPAFADLPLVQFENALNVRINYKARIFQLARTHGLCSRPFWTGRVGNRIDSDPSFSLRRAAQGSAVLVGLASVFVGRRRDRRLWGLAGALFALFMPGTMRRPFSEPTLEFDSVAALPPVPISVAAFGDIGFTFRGRAGSRRLANRGDAGSRHSFCYWAPFCLPFRIFFRIWPHSYRFWSARCNSRQRRTPKTRADCQLGYCCQVAASSWFGVLIWI